MALIIKCNKLTTRDHHSLPNNQRKVVTIKNQPFWQSVDHRAPLSVNPVQFNIGCSTGWSLWALVVGKPTHVSEGHSMTQVGGGGGDVDAWEEWQPIVTATLTYVVTLMSQKTL